MLNFNDMDCIATSLTFDGMEVKGIADMPAPPQKIAFECTMRFDGTFIGELPRNLTEKREVRILTPQGAFVQGPLVSIKETLNEFGELEIECQMEITKRGRGRRFSKMNPARLPL